MLIMRDGSKYVGNFENGEIKGAGERFWEDGTHYVGEWHLGEKHGLGKIDYPNGDWYEGNWHLNKRHGEGKLSLAKTQVTYTGTFNEHWPNGHIKIENYKDSSVYEGEVVKCIKQG